MNRLEAPLAGSDHMVEANRLIGALLGSVFLRPDEDSRDGLRVTIRCSVGWLIGHHNHVINAKSLPKEALREISKISVVAGVGFEPTTFRL